MRVILASASPRRRDLLEQMGVQPVVRPSDIDESVLPGEPAEDYVRRLSAAKAMAIAADPTAMPTLVARLIPADNSPSLRVPKRAS